MNLEFVDELSTAMRQLATDQAARVVVITGIGRGFSSGHTLDDFENRANRRASIQHAMEVQRLFSALIVQIRRMPQPVIAAVNGPAAGGGLAMALAADTRLCSESTRFNAAFVRIGLSGCDVGVSYLLPRIVGPTLAFEMMLTGRLIDAEEAARSGLVLQVLPDGEVVQAALDIADMICANSPFGVCMTKEVMWANLDAPSLEAAIALENRTQVLCVNTADQTEALRSFLAKRPGTFVNR